MSKDEAIAEMSKGKKVTHDGFTCDEWMTMTECGKFQFEDGVICSMQEFWMYRTSENWNQGWSLFNEQ